MAQRLLRTASLVLHAHSPNLHAPLPPSFLLLSRGFANMKLFVGGLSFRTDDEGLRSAFSSHGEVTDVRIITDRETGRSRGFGFVTYLSESDADTALSKMDGHILDGRVIRVDRASSRTPAPRPLEGGAVGGFGSGFSVGSDPSPPASSPEDWGAIPLNVANVPQNAQASSTTIDPIPSAPAEVPRSVTGNSLSDAVPQSVQGNDAPQSVQGSSLSDAIPLSVPENNAIPSITTELPQNKSSSDWGAIMTNFAAVPESKETTTAGAGSWGSIPSNAAELPPIRASTAGGASDWGTIPSNIADVPQNKGDFKASESTSSTFPSPGIGSSAFAPSVFGSASSSAASSGNSGFDYTNFPAFDSSSYQNEHPLPRRRPRPRPRPIPQSSASSFNFGFNSSQETKSPFGSSDGLDTGIPKPKGPEFDFGLSEIPSTPPQSEPGVRPQGGFDINIPADAPEIPIVRPAPPQPKPLGFSIFQPRIVAPPGLPYDTPEADNWSEIGKETPKLSLSSLYSPLRSFVSKERELHWDPYDFDEDAKLPEPEAQPEASQPEVNAAL